MTLLALVGICFCAFLLWATWRYILPVHLSPLTLLPGPPSPSMVYGHFRQISNVNNHLMMHEWADKYGPNCLIRWFMQVRWAKLVRNVY